VRAKAVAFGKKWIDVAAHIGSPGVRVNMPPAKDIKPEAAVVAESLKMLAVYGASKNVVVHHENDNPLSENPFFIADVLDRVNSPWDRALPDCGNSFSALANGRGLPGARANVHARLRHLSCKRRFHDAEECSDCRRFGARVCYREKAQLQRLLSMEWDTEGDPYAGTEKLIVATLKNIS
jgi:sugar phosphate isomerase/epimerase